MSLTNRLFPGALLLVALIVTGATSYSEFLYSLMGRETQGVVTDVYNHQVRRSFNRIAEYEFTGSDGARRTGRTIVSSDWNVPVGGKVTVIYAPGGRSRLSAYPDWSSVIIFFVTLGVVVVVAVVWLLRALLANRASPTRRRRKNRRREE